MNSVFNIFNLFQSDVVFTVWMVEVYHHTFSAELWETGTRALLVAMQNFTAPTEENSAASHKTSVLALWPRDPTSRTPALRNWQRKRLHTVTHWGNKRPARGQNTRAVEHEAAKRRREEDRLTRKDPECAGKGQSSLLINTNMYFLSSSSGH